MTITINGPDGSKFNFPDDATPDEINGAMQQHYGTMTQQPDAANPTSFSPPGVDPNDTRFSLGAMDTKQAIRGVPVLGPAISDRGSAAMTTLAHRFTGFGAPTYAENLAQETQARQAYEAAHPVRGQAIQALGGTIALGGAGEIPAVARALGMTGRLAQAVPRGALTGAGIGAADYAARGEDPTTGGVVGALSGAGGPLAGRLMGKVWDRARGMMRPLSDVPERFLPQPVAGVNIPVRESVLTRDLPTAREEQIMLKGEGVPAAVQAEQATTDAMKQAHTNLANQLDPSGQSVTGNPLDAGNAAISDLVQQEQQRAQAEMARQLGAEQGTMQLQTDIGAGAPPPASAADAGQAASTGIRGLFQQARQATRAAYNAAAAVPASYNPRYLINAGDTIRRALDTLPGNQRVRISPEVTPQAQAALNTIDQEIAQLRFTNDAARGARPIMPQDMEQVRKQLVIQRRLANNAARTTGNWEDARAVGRVMDAFDAWEATTANRPGGLLTGNPADVIASRQAARAAHAQERATFSRRGPGDAVGTFMENVIGKYPGQEMSPDKIVRTLMGSPDSPGTENAVPILNHLRDNVFGVNSPQWQQIKQGVISHLTQALPGADAIPYVKQAQRIDRLLGNRRLADALFTPAEQARLQGLSGQFRGVQDVAPGAGSVDKWIADLSGRTTGRHATGDELIRDLAGSGGGDLATALQQRLSPEALGGIKAAMFKRIAEAPEGMIPWEHQKSGQNIAKFLSTDLAQKLYSPSERMVMRAISDAHLQIVPLPGSTNPSGSAYTGRAMAAHAAKNFTRYLFRMIGLSHGGLPGLFASEMGARAREAIAERMAGRAAQQRAEELFLGRSPMLPSTRPQAVGALAGPLLTQQGAAAQQ